MVQAMLGVMAIGVLRHEVYGALSAKLAVVEEQNHRLGALLTAVEEKIEVALVELTRRLQEQHDLREGKLLDMLEKLQQQQMGRGCHMVMVSG